MTHIKTLDELNETNDKGWTEEFDELFTTWESWTTTNKNKISSRVTPDDIKAFIAKEKEESRREVFEAIMKLEWNYDTYEQQVIEREDIKDYAKSLGIDLSDKK